MARLVGCEDVILLRLGKLVRQRKDITLTGMISASRRKNTVRAMRIEMDKVTYE